VADAATELRMRAVTTALAGYRYRYANEVQLHERMAEVLAAADLQHVREFVIDARNRADFWLDGLVVEVKVDGTFQDALRQIGRYIEHERVRGVVLASTKPWAAQPLAKRPYWQGKPFAMVHLTRQAL